MKNKLKNIQKQVLDFLLSPRLVAFYWHSAGMILAGFLNIVAEQLTTIETPGVLVVILGLIIGQTTKALDNKNKNKALGFVRE